MIARDVKIDFTTGIGVIDWNSSVSGLHLLQQKLCLSMLTKAGTDKFQIERGTQLETRLYQSGIYDAQSAQHELNFAAVNSRRDVRMGRDAGLSDPTSEVKSFQIALLGIVNNRIQTALQIESVSGAKSAEILTI